jgi:diguanylate cyclase (GGDEF)-like protein/PAS domain S-box-containing protein
MTFEMNYGPPEETHISTVAGPTNRRQAKQHALPGECETGRLLHELQVHQIELENQNSELRRARDEVELALGRYTDLYDFAPIGYLTLERGADIIAVNLSGASLLGVARASLVGRNFASFLAGPARPVFAAFMARVFALPGKHSCEVSLNPELGTPLFVLLEAAVCNRGLECRIALLDLTDYRHTQMALANSETRYRRLFETARNGILILETDTARITDVNPFLCQLLACRPEEILGRQLWETGLFPDARTAAPALAQLRGQGAVSCENLPVRARDGRQLVLDFVGSVYQVDQASVIQCDIRDVTSKKRAEEDLQKSEEQCRTIVNNINEYVYSVHFESGAVSSIFHSPQCFDVTGYSPEEYHGDPLLWITMVHPDDRELVTAFLNKIFAGQCCAPIRHRIKHKDGSERWLLNSCAVQMSEKGAVSTISRLDGFILDITDLKLAEENIFFLAHHDPLTGLPNRSTLYLRIAQVLSVAQKAGRSIALLFLDIDDFKKINDSLGHDVGDRFLQSVAGRLKDCTRSCDIVARLGGDEFVMVLWDCGAEEATVVAKKIVAHGFSIEGSSAAVNTSIGISLFPEDGADYLTLVKHADIAMYQAKKSGGKGFQFFTRRLNELARERFRVESELRQALKLGEFVLYYQPKVDIVSGKSSGMEALVRWQHPTRGLVLPGAFIDIAEESGLLTPISKWTVLTVCRQIRLWKEQGIDPVSVAINLSASFFQHPDFEETIESALRETGVAPGCLELELTEATIMNDPRRVLESMAAMKSLGLQLSIDDFGIGYSCLSYLTKLPVDKLKIDQSFMRNIVSDTDNMAVVRAVFNIGRSMRLKVIVEGVETASQLAWLQAEGGEEAQGYFFSLPLPEKSMTALLKQGPNFLHNPRGKMMVKKWH